MLLIPRVSEKAYGATLKNIYVFDVPATTNKAEIKKALEKDHKDIEIKSIRIVIAKGKVKASARGKHARPGVAARSDIKKAYVTLSKGKIEIAAFKAEEPQTDEAKDAKEAKTTKEPKAAIKEAEKVETKKAGLFAKRRTGRRGDK